MDRRYNQWHLQAEPGKDFRLAIDWWGWGDHVEVVTQPDDVEQSEWVAYFRLANLDGDLSNRNINFDALSSFDLAEGASNFTIDKSMKEPRIKIGGSPVTYVMRRGEGDRFSAIEVHDINANGSSEAMVIARAHFNYLSALLTYWLQLPLRYSAAAVRPKDSLKAHRFRVYHPWPDCEITAFNIEIPAVGIILPLITQYCEGVASNSHAYRFLCFYKIVDHLLDRAGELRKVHSKFSDAAWIELQDNLPEEPTKYLDADLVGKKYTQARERYRKSDIRNAVAHIVPSSQSFDPLDPESDSHYKAIGAVCRFMAHHLIRIVGVNAKALVEVGAAPEEISHALF